MPSPVSRQDVRRQITRSASGAVFMLTPARRGVDQRSLPVLASLNTKTHLASAAPGRPWSPQIN